jgi:hypothetical protein
MDFPCITLDPELPLSALLNISPPLLFTMNN